MIFILRILSLLLGWHTKEKIVVIESDDWGSIRMASRESYDELKKKGYLLEKSQYSWDSLETEEDLDKLYSVLDKIHDINGRPACFTANIIVANPDFEKIKEAKFNEYFYKPVKDTNKIYNKWLEGLKCGFFIPQLHGREHIQWWTWLKTLQQGDREAIDTFKLKMCGVPLKVSKKKTSFYSPIYLHPFDLQKVGVDLEKIIKEGVKLFKQYFGYKSISTVAPNVTWSDTTEEIWYKYGIRYIQSGMWQFKALPNNKIKRKFRYLGQRGRHGLIYLVRNCFFEPIKTPGDKDVWRKTLNQVALAFLFKKPAIIGMHRVNFVGAIKASYRENSLNQLFLLLKYICERWPNVNFLSSPELGYMIENGLIQVSELKTKRENIYPKER